jgi:hypothetical protein
MATRIWSLGAEQGINELNYRPARGATTVTTTKTRTGTYAFTIPSNDPASWGRILPTPLTQFQTAYWINHMGVGGTDTAIDRSSYLFTFLRQDGTLYRIGWQHTNLYWFVASAITTNFFSTANGTGTTGDFNLTDVWHHVGLDVKIDNAAGWIKLYINGLLALDFTGNTGTSPVTAVGYAGSASSNGDWNAFLYYDDVYLDDTTGEAASVPIQKRFMYLAPNGNGELSQFTGSDGNSTDNYLLVDEVSAHDDDATFVQASANGLIDSYTHAALTTPDNFVPVALITSAFAKKTDATVDTEYQARLHKGSDNSLGVAKDLATGYTLLQDRFTTLPDATPLGDVNINDTEIGIVAAGAY